jgi:DNA-binding transcriptional regulator YiaG
VADHAGIDRSTYIGYEDTSHDSYPLDKLTRIAEFLQVSVTDLLDNYNRFLYERQGEQMKALRKKLHMTQAEFSRQLQTPIGTVKRWEQNQARMTKGMWERMVNISAPPSCENSWK